MRSERNRELIHSLFFFLLFWGVGGVEGVLFFSSVPFATRLFNLFEVYIFFLCRLITNSALLFCVKCLMFTALLTVALHEVTWCMVVWCTQNAPRWQQFHVAPTMPAL